MATIITKCKGCDKEVPMEIDTTEEKFIGNVMKDGAICETCTPPFGQNDECYFGKSVIETMEEEQYKLAKRINKEIVEKLFGETEKIKRYKPLALPTECRFTEGEVPKPYPKLEFEEVDALEVYKGPEDK